MEIQGYCDKETQYRNTSAIHHASDLAFEPIDLDVEPRLHQFNFKNNGRSWCRSWSMVFNTLVPISNGMCWL
jgi:hypothetical protein